MLLAVTCACDKAGEGIVLAAEGKCSARVIVSFAAEPDAAFVQDIERAHALELAPLGAISGDIRAYLLRAAGSEAECRAAIERLRTDERVRSIDPDVRRAVPADPSSNREQTR